VILVTVAIPGVISPHTVLADTETSGVQDALYTLGLEALPEGSIVTTESVGGYPCSSAT